MSLFSDPDSSFIDGKKGMAEGTMTDDEDDAKLTNNQRIAMNMHKPEYVKKLEQEHLQRSSNAFVSATASKKHSKYYESVDLEPLTKAQRMLNLHKQ